MSEDLTIPGGKRKQLQSHSIDRRHSQWCLASESRGIAAAQWFQTALRIAERGGVDCLHRFRRNQKARVVGCRGIIWAEGEPRLRSIMIIELLVTGIRFETDAQWTIGQRLRLSFKPPYADEPARQLEVIDSESLSNQVCYTAIVTQ